MKKYFIIILFFCLQSFITEKSIAQALESIAYQPAMHKHEDNHYANKIPVTIQIVADQDISCYGVCDGILKARILSGVPPFIYLWSNGETTKIINQVCAGTYTVTVTDSTGSIGTATRFIAQPSDLLPHFNKTEISSSGANDGILTWSTNGGTAPYNYLWNDGNTTGNRTNIAPGTYTITVSDSTGCSKTVTILWENPSYQNKILYVTQLHIHGWSNHNGLNWPKPGSLQYHNKQADSAGINVLWWSEHTGIFRPFSVSFPLTGATVEPVTLDIINIPSPSDTFPNNWKCLSKQGTCSASVDADTVNLSFHSAAAAFNFKSFSYAPRYNKHLILNSGFVKPLASRPALQCMIRPSFGNVANTRIEFVFKLSWHLRANDRQDIITFQVVDSSFAPSAVTNGQDSVTVVMPVINNSWQQVQFDLAEAAALLDHGIDNTLSDYELKLLSKNGDSISSQFSDFKLIPLQPNTDSLIKAERVELDYNNSIYPVHNIFGIEFSGKQHLNGFFPDTVNNIDIFQGVNNGVISNWAQNVHLQGGLVSYNHMFFQDMGLDSAAIQDYRSDTMATHILANQAYQSDILEVGYYQRGGCDLEHHLLTWDILTANGLFLYGDGVSDAHGSLWIDRDDLFHTYIYAADSSSYELLNGLSHGHMFFANKKFFNSSFYYTLGNLEMGDRGFSNQSFAMPVIHLDPFPPKCKIRLTQVLLNNSNQLTYLHNLTLIDTAALPLLDVSQPCFIRFAIYDSLDYPIAFGQPIVVLDVISNVPEQPKDNSGVDIKIFPNPTDEYLNLELYFAEHGNYNVSLFDTHGKAVKQIDNRYFYTGKYGYRIDIRGLLPATYILNVTSDNKSISRKVEILH